MGGNGGSSFCSGNLVLSSPAEAPGTGVFGTAGTSGVLGTGGTKFKGETAGPNEYVTAGIAGMLGTAIWLILKLGFICGLITGTGTFQSEFPFKPL